MPIRHLPPFASSLFSLVGIAGLSLSFVMPGSRWLRNYLYAFAAEVLGHRGPVRGGRLLWRLSRTPPCRAGDGVLPRPVPALPDPAGWAESPRGSLFYAVHVGGDGALSRVKIKSPSFSNWRVFPFTVHGSNMMDYATNEASGSPAGASQLLGIAFPRSPNGLMAPTAWTGSQEEWCRWLSA